MAVGQTFDDKQGYKNLKSFDRPWTASDSMLNTDIPPSTKENSE